MTFARSCWCLDLGIMDFKQAHALQLEVIEARTANRIGRDVLLFLEHPPVITMGRRGGWDNLKVTPSFLADSGIHLHHIERGGDITYHGPGQLVVYPIVHLKEAGLGVLGFVECLEEAMIRTAADWGIPAGRDPRNRGVWVGESKMGSIGIAVRRGIAFHGLALNVDLSLKPYAWITPCGLPGIGMTSMNLEANKPATVSEVKSTLRHYFEEVFCITLQDINLYNLKKYLK